MVSGHWFGFSICLGAGTLLASGAVAVALHMLAALVGKGFEPDILAGVLGSLHHEVENWQTIFLTELVQEYAGDGSRHASER